MANFNPLVKVHKPSYNWHDLSFDSMFSTNFGVLNSVMARHFFTGERVRCGMEHILKMAPLLSPVFQRYDVRIDSFVVPDRLVWKDAYNFYKGGKDGITDLPAPNLPIGVLYNCVLLAEFYSSNKITDTTLKTNPLTGTIVDMLNLPTFDQLLTTEYWGNKLITTSDSVSQQLIDTMIADLSDTYSITFTEATAENFPFYSGSSVNSILRQLFSIYICLLTKEASDPEKVEKPLECTLVPILQYQYIWSQYYRNQFVQDNSQITIVEGVDDPDVDIRSAYWLEPSVDAVKDYLLPVSKLKCEVCDDPEDPTSSYEFRFLPGYGGIYDIEG